MIRKTGRAAQLWNRSEKATQTHLKRHLHLTNCIHLKHHSHMQKTRMKLELGSPSELPLIRELSTLRKSRSLRDPSTSPSCRSGSLVQKLDRETGKDVSEWQVPVHTLGSVESVPDNLRGNAALQSPSAELEEGESSEMEGWVEISPEDGMQLGATYTLHHHGPHIMIRDGDLKLESHITSEITEEEACAALYNWETKIGASDLLNAVKKGEIEKQEGCQGLLSTSAGGSREVTTSGRDGGSLEREKEQSPFGSDSTSKSKPRNRSTNKGKVQRGERLYAHSPSAAQLAIYAQDRWLWRSSAIMDMVSANEPGENDELEICELPQNGCGIPWNWSRIHSRGKNLLDIAGRSVSCGASDPLARRLGNALSRGHLSSSEESMPVTTSEFSDTSFNTDSESFPLLEHGLYSVNSSPSEGGPGEHSGQDQTESSELPSKSSRRRFPGGHSFLSSENSHHSLSQKYMPKSFQDIVGQNLITQALSNALLRGRIAPIYIFYGPRGTGKTSCARVFATALNCTSPEELRPCGSCTECLVHKFGKTSTVKEFNAGGGLQGARGIKMFMHDVTRYSSSHYRVFIVDECQTLSSQAWNALMKAVEESPRNIVFVLSTSSLEQLPHAVISRCQKFIFSKIKESEVINRLQLIAVQEGLEADPEALKLIASACDGSLRDAEMMLDQLSLLGQKISLSMAQELMGLVPDENLVDLLDFALSADTINTVRNLKELMVSGVEPLNLMSQLACLITSILAGGFQIPKARHKRKFFRNKQLAKEDMERLRQALKTLSEAEKQLRGSSDRTTWLTAALLQFAPDQSYLLPSTSADTSFTQSPAGMNASNGTPNLNSSYSRVQQVDFQHRHGGSFSEAGSGATATEVVSNGMSGSLKASVGDTWQGPLAIYQPQMRSRKSRGPKLVSESGHIRTTSSTQSRDFGHTTMWQTTLTNDFELDEVWQRVLDAVHSSSLRKFLQTQGKLLSLSISKGFAAAILEFSQLESTSRAERSRTSIAHAFQVTLGYPVDVKVRLASTTDEQTRRQAASAEDQPSGSSTLWQPAWISRDGNARSGNNIAVEKNGHDDVKSQGLHRRTHHSLEVYTVPTCSSRSQNTQKTNHSIEIVALESGRSSSQPAATIGNHALEDKLESAWVQGAPGKDFFMRPSSKSDKHHEDARFRSNSNQKNQVSLGFAIQQAEDSVEGYSQDLQFDHMNEGSTNQHFRHRGTTDFGFSGSAAHNMAAELEEENLRLESRSGGLLCWKGSDRDNEKVEQLQESPKRPGFLSSLCPCSKSNQ